MPAHVKHSSRSGLILRGNRFGFAQREQCGTATTFLKRQGFMRTVWPWGFSLAFHTVVLTVLWLYSIIFGGSAMLTEVPHSYGTNLPTITAVAAIPESEELQSSFSVSATPMIELVPVVTAPQSVRLEDARIEELQSWRESSPLTTTWKPDVDVLAEAGVVERQSYRGPPDAPTKIVEPTVDPVAPPSVQTVAPIPPDPRLAVESKTEAPGVEALKTSAAPTPEATESVVASGGSTGLAGQATNAGAAGRDRSYPQPLHNNAPPEYPEEAIRRGWEGTVVLRLRITAMGIVEEVTVASGSGFSVLDEAAVAAVKVWRFRPARPEERDVTTTVLQPVVFDLSRQSRVSAVSPRMSK
jgi:protein TonB